MSKYIIMSDEKPRLTQALSPGYTVIPTDTIRKLLPFESRHADMQCLRINDTFFVLKEAVELQKRLRSLGLKVEVTEEDIEAEYPKNVLLNAVYLNNRLYCSINAVAGVVKRFCEQSGIELINVRQGYAKCSTAVAGDCFITADRGIFEVMTANGAEGLLTESGGIELEGVDYGFIGGCSFYADGALYFTGDITGHKSWNEIQEFLYKKGISVRTLSDEKLYDIGGLIAI